MTHFRKPLPCIPQEMLRNGVTLLDLYDRYGITSKRSLKFPNLVQLKYSQLDSDFRHDVVCQSRGLILDEGCNWSIVARPFDKFFNWGEPLAASIDWATARVQEKLDGSLIIMYYYRGDWYAATSGSPDASGSVGGLDINFRDLFWRTFEGLNLYKPTYLQASRTFMFELMTPYNKVVVQHDQPSIKLIGVRDNWAGDYVTYALSDYPKVDEYKLYTMDSIQRTFSEMDPTVQEGYVIVDGNGNRIKVKHPGYVALHHLKDGIKSPRNILEAVLKNETTELLTHFPEWKESFAKVTAAVDGLEIVLSAAWQEAFALEALKRPASNVLFNLRNGYIENVRQGILAMPSERLVKVLGLKETVNEYTAA
jgi:T4 RnlA family RNA ligase